MKTKQVFGGSILGLALGLALAWALALGADARAQSAGRDVAIAPGPGGMWIVQGGTVRVCVGGPIQSGVNPPAPRCGDAAPLR